MAGIWNRIYDRGEQDDPVASLVLVSVVFLVARGVFTAAQARDALNSRLETPLTTAEEADLSDILTGIQTGTVTDRLDYLLRVQSLAITAEVHLLNSEATFRSELGLS